MSQTEVLGYLGTVIGAGGLGSIVTALLANRRLTNKDNNEHSQNVIDVLLERIEALELQNVKCMEESAILRERIGSLETQLAYLTDRMDRE